MRAIFWCCPVRNGGELDQCEIDDIKTQQKRKETSFPPSRIDRSEQAAMNSAPLFFFQFSRMTEKERGPALLFVRGKKPDANRQVRQQNAREERERESNEKLELTVNCQPPFYFTWKWLLKRAAVQWNGSICPGESQDVGWRVCKSIGMEYEKYSSMRSHPRSVLSSSSPFSIFSSLHSSPAMVWIPKEEKDLETVQPSGAHMLVSEAGGGRGRGSGPKVLKLTEKRSGVIFFVM